MIKLIIFNESNLFRNMMSKLLSGNNNIKVLGEYDSTDDFEKVINKSKPNMIITSVFFKEKTNGLKLAGEIKKLYPNIKVIVMSGTPEITLLDRAKEAKADSFFYKDIFLDELYEIIFKTFNGESIFPDKLKSYEKSKILENLTPREKEILYKMCESKNNTTVAKELNISEKTLKNHITSILEKTGYNNIARLATYSCKNGLLNPDIN